MYLSNIDLKKILSEMRFSVPVNGYEFNESKQLQICSIDLRLSSIFWKTKKLRKPLDLRKSSLLKQSPRRLWKKIDLNMNESIIIKPKRMLLGQTFESFYIPPKYAGKIITRSSYARLGLDTNCSTDFINPGYEGHVPLELINNSDSSIVLHPLLPVCQLLLIPLSSMPDGVYGDEKYKSKYQNDDGGPSYWWKDKLLESIINQSISYELEEQTIKLLLEKVNDLDEDCISRFEIFFGKLKQEELTNADSIIDKFKKKEKRKKVKSDLLKGLKLLPLTISLGIFVTRILTPNFKFDSINIGLLCAVIISFGIFVYAILYDDAKFYI